MAFCWSLENYSKSVFKKGFVYKLSANPSAVCYIAENKTLAAKYYKTYEGEALGRKLAVVLFEDARGGFSGVCTETALGCNNNY